MNINETVKGIFIKLAKKMGLELSEKSKNDIDFTADGLNPTAIGSGVVANIAIDDSDIIIDGTNARAEAIREIKDYYTDELQTAVAEVSLGTGDCIVRPYTDGKYIGLNIIGNNNFVITESIGTHIKGVIMLLDEYTTDNNTYRLFESQTLKDDNENSVVYIRRFAYKGSSETDITKTHWENLATEEVITADQLLLGRYKCPTINRDDYNSVNGVPITFGCEGIIENIKTKYEQYNEEFDRKQSLIFADRTMFKRDNDTQSTVKGDKLKIDGTTFMKVKGSLNGGVGEMIQDYSPAIRESEFQAANNFNLSVLELCCGFSRGVFTSPETSFATATEMKNSLKKTFAFVKRFRKRLELGDKMLFHAIDIMMNSLGTTPMGEWTISHDWSYDYIEETRERFNQLMQGHSAGVVSDETLCAWINNLKEDEAAAYMEELRSATEPEETDDTDTDGFDDKEDKEEKDE